ncbi:MULTISPECIES: hypothetical protein [unclassified Brenneria]|uniref:hypothetical protein n=1 Tax=unclassified Brenneria TaxID=2634434 RepID=UPI0029C25B4A|nr:MULTISPECIES: hypothetical protein [unclassified Brenneria]MDX5630381.1 hypothetical protein [Brenneria sp. L3-3Z]MDX5697526.1 hypothetical protein [Brenneria sp. L4-2C]
MMKSRLWSIAVVATLSACASKPVTVPVLAPHTQSISATPSPIEVVHTARYTLVSLTPDETLTFPLRQVTSHTLPAPKKNRPIATRCE